jgi:6-phosphofructo-2-kinase/fructose-2,6-biphosphatase 2
VPSSYAYFHNLPQADLPYIKIPLHTVIKLTPKAYGCDEERCVALHLRRSTYFMRFRFTLPIGAVDTHRPKPSGSDVSIAPTSSKREYFGDDKK